MALFSNEEIPTSRSIEAVAELANNQCKLWEEAINALPYHVRDSILLELKCFILDKVDGNDMKQVNARAVLQLCCTLSHC
jgi:hypothetical protein